jgi:hypothetical protein
MKDVRLWSFIMTTALVLVGCATAGQIISGNPSAVVVRHDGSYAASTKLAEQHCAQYGKDVRLIHTEGFIMSFDCVPR